MKGLIRGQGRVFMRGKKYWIAYYVRGEEHRESGGNTKADAKRKLKTRLNEIHSDKFIDPRTAKITVNELLDNYLTHLKNKGAKSVSRLTSDLKRIREYFGCYRAINVKPPMVDQYISEQLKRGFANATINRGLSALKTAFNLARKQEILNDVPFFTTLREDNARQGFFEKAEYEAILSHLPGYLKGAVQLAYKTGWRRAEILNLTWESVDLQAKELRLWTSKNREGRCIPLQGELWDVIERQWAAREVNLKDRTLISHWVFHNKGKQIQSFYKAWHTACDAAGYPGKLPHDFRRTAARNMTRAGVTETVAMSITGHKTNSMFRRYNITSQEDKKQALLDTEEYVRGQSSEKKIYPLPTGTLPKK
ncbi:MAG: site-specific integrase [Nitrospina sp.]|nr:site-specific integrase [Nitrospina sp.]